MAAPNHPLANRPARQQTTHPVSTTQLAQATWILREMGSGTRHATDTWLLEHLGHVKVGFELGSTQAIKRLAAAGTGLACLSRKAVADDVSNGTLVALQTSLPVAQRRLARVVRRDKPLGRAILGFMAHCRQAKTLRRLHYPCRFMHARPQNPEPLLSALQRRLPEVFAAGASAHLTRLPDKGLAHDHVRLVGTGLLARIPKQSQMQLGALDNLAYQKACFEHAAPSGHTPKLVATLAPDALLPWGSLLVEEIVGTPAVLPDQLPALIQALAALHALPVPAPAARAPLQHSQDPALALAQEVATQAHYLPQAGLAPGTLRLMEAALSDMRQRLCADHRPPITLIAFDGHPGNFIVRPNGQAVLVDLEKCRYSYPGLDLAHATLYTSTTWDMDSHAVLSDATVLDAYATWGRAVSPALASAALPWHGTLRRAMGLWSLTWCAKWRVLSSQQTKGLPIGEDWSQDHSDAVLVAHVRERVDHYLSEETVAQLMDGFDHFESALK